jgi:hypothetical protein
MNRHSDKLRELYDIRLNYWIGLTRGVSYKGGEGRGINCPYLKKGGGGYCWAMFLKMVIMLRKCIFGASLTAYLPGENFQPTPGNRFAPPALDYPHSFHFWRKYWLHCCQRHIALYCMDDCSQGIIWGIL